MDSSETFDIALCQYELCDVGSFDALLERIAAGFDRAGTADLYILPELFVNDYLEEIGTDDSIATLSSEEETRFHDFLVTAADRRNAVIVGGSYNIIDGDAIHNRCPISSPDSSIVTYDKSHLIPEERTCGKREGADLPPVIEHDGIGIGVAICYDVEFPDIIRGLANRGAEVVAVPSWTAEEAGYQRVSRCSAARAVENQMYLAQVCLVGARPDAGLSATGRSTVFAPCDDIVGPHGTRLSLARDMDATGVCPVDISTLRKSRTDASVRPYTDSNR
ncbi:nitrilase-related carbon-nitrogen hydrolase [Haladaptatus caseinilyticus]|uniref:nitrilase-related carbon-nitrogen hydrolase n=1 Tax=Haladaptatus caseinilyticus TaxID=2993314 RepID=UPI00224B7057|nr:nitrilase-related carbon-nitrogen hydrolase [Haladaptatus caseinilyticus]